MTLFVSLSLSLSFFFFFFFFFYFFFFNLADYPRLNEDDQGGLVLLGTNWFAQGGTGGYGGKKMGKGETNDEIFAREYGGAFPTLSGGRGGGRGKGRGVVKGKGGRGKGRGGALPKDSIWRETEQFKKMNIQGGGGGQRGAKLLLPISSRLKLDALAEVYFPLFHAFYCFFFIHFLFFVFFLLEIGISIY